MELIKKSEQPTAQGVKERVSIKRIVEQYVELKKAGKGWLGHCPLPIHEDSNPSFQVFEDTQRFYCHGCNSKGDVISFIRAITGCSFSEALRILDGEPKGEIIPIVTKSDPPKRVGEKLEAYYQKIFDSSSKWEGYEYSVKSIGGISSEAWKQLGVAWSDEKKCWVIPARNAACEIVGFQFRGTDGSKWYLTGTRLGLFIPRVPVPKVAYICEGASDCGALLSAGLYAFARPSALAGIDMVVEFAHSHNIERVIIMSDNNDAGKIGAKKLSERIGIENKIVLPFEHKDIRSAIIAGVTREQIESLTSERNGS